ncbi:hypothetical protein ACA910_021792 [Epithemia clementina (nom. ined.)]
MQCVASNSSVALSSPVVRSFHTPKERMVSASPIKEQFLKVKDHSHAKHTNASPCKKKETKSNRKSKSSTLVSPPNMGSSASSSLYPSSTTSPPFDRSPLTQDRGYFTIVYPRRFRKYGYQDTRRYRPSTSYQRARLYPIPESDEEDELYVAQQPQVQVRQEQHVQQQHFQTRQSCGPAEQFSKLSFFHRFSMEPKACFNVPSTKHQDKTSTTCRQPLPIRRKCNVTSVNQHCLTITSERPSRCSEGGYPVSASFDCDSKVKFPPSPFTHVAPRARREELRRREVFFASPPPSYSSGACADAPKSCDSPSPKSKSQFDCTKTVPVAKANHYYHGETATGDERSPSVPEAHAAYTYNNKSKFTQSTYTYSPRQTEWEELRRREIRFAAPPTTVQLTTTP